MATLGTELVSGSPAVGRFWLSASDEIGDARVFLVRAGSVPLFSRVCTRADLINWPGTDTDDFGWYRTSGLSFPLEHGEDLKQIHSSLQDQLETLEAELSASPAAVSVTESLKYCRTGASFGSLDISRQDYNDYSCLTLGISLDAVDLAAEATASAFVADAAETELLRILDITDGADGSGIGDTETLESSVTVWVRKGTVGAFVSSVLDDLSDFYTYVALQAGLTVF